MTAPKILMISPLPTHPGNAGNRARVYHLANALQRLGAEVYFLYTGIEAGDSAAMNAHWGDRIIYFSGGLPHWSRPQRLLRFLRALPYAPQERDYNFFVDDWYNDALDDLIGQLHQRHRFSAAIAEYVFQSRALLNFGPEVIKLLDTHDIFTNRYRVLLDNGVTQRWFSTYEKEEAKALDRADAVIAIQEQEKPFFEKISRSRVITAGHILTCTPLERPAFEKKLLFVASFNPSNRDGIGFFIDAVLGPLAAKYPDVELLVAGTVCRHLSAAGPRVRLLGEFDDHEKIYAAADIVVNPIRFGTGLCIKTLEALSFGKPLVASSAAARGLEPFSGTAFLVADTAQGYLDALASLFENEARRQQLARQALAAVQSCNDASMAQLANVLRPILSGAPQ